MIANFEERRSAPTMPSPERKMGDGGGPGRPDVQKPDTKRLMDRMKRVDPDQAKRYRQRSGQ